MIETGGPTDFTALTSDSRFREWTGDDWQLTGTVELPLHRLTHRTIHATVYRLEIPSLSPAVAAWAIPTERLGDYAVPRLLERYLSK